MKDIKKETCYYCGKKIEEKDLQWITVSEDSKSYITVPIHRGEIND